MSTKIALHLLPFLTAAVSLYLAVFILTGIAAPHLHACLFHTALTEACK